MRTFIIILITAALAGLATWFLPWWMVAVVAFLMAVLLYLPPGKAFRVGAFSIMSLCFSLYILVTIVVAALVGGLAGWAGGLMNFAFRRK